MLSRENGTERTKYLPPLQPADAPSLRRTPVKALVLALAALGLLLPTAAAQQPIVDQFEERSQTFEGFTLPYRLFVPADYDPAVPYPLVLALHGAGERGTNNESHIVPHRLATSWADPANQAEYPTFVVAPQVPPGLRWSAEQPAEQSDFTAVQLTTLAILDALAAEFTLDPDRLYITGLSMGGHGTWDFIARQPHRWAAAVPMHGRTYPQNAEAVMDVPIWAFHGENDGVVEPAGTRRIVQAMEDLGRDVLYTECRRSPPFATNFDCPGPIPSDSLAEAIEDHVDFIYTAIEDGGHGPWSPLYDRPLLNDWVFSKFRRDPDAIAATAPTAGDVWAGTEAVTWSAPGPATDLVEVWLRPDSTSPWERVGTADAGDGAFALDTTPYSDSPLARVRLFVLNDRGFVYGRTTTAPFVIDNPGDAPPFLSVDDEFLRFDPEFTAETLEIDVVAADPEGEALAAGVFYSIDGGATFAQVETLTLSSSPAPQTVAFDVGGLPNSPAARVRVEVSDGTNAVARTTAAFAKTTPRQPVDTAEQVAGEGVGTVTLHFVDPASLTGHRYRITIDDADPDAKTYTVTDLDLGTPVLTGIPLSDGVLESPIFDGIALVVEDLAEGMPDLEATGWTVGDTDLGVSISGGTIRIAILTVELLATEDDYELVIADGVVGTSVAGYGIPAQDLSFTVTAASDGLPRGVIFDDEDDDGLPGDGDVLYLLEEDADGTSQPAWRFTFEATPTTTLPEPGDTFTFVPLRSLSAADVFEFDAVPVATESAPTEFADALGSYPNPFSDEVTVVFDLGAPSEATLEVFDVLGRRVAVVAEGVREAGTHEVRWAGGGASGSRLASGLYVLRLTARPLSGAPGQSTQRSVTRVD
jgi:poly(3-hydroxybutyrate) depolymerase